MVSALNIIGSDRSLQEHWVKRLLAVLVDSIIIYVVGSVLMFFAIIPLNWGIPNPWVVMWPAFSGVLLFLYCMILESTSSGATIGKRLLGLRAIALTGDMGIGKAAMRNLSKVYGLFLILDWAIGFVSEGDPKQKWLDRVAGTTVIITTALTDQDQHIYQSQQSKYAPPPQEPYQPTRHEQVYQYPPPATPTQTPAQQAKGPAQSAGQEAACNACGGRMAETGSGRLKCIRCGKIQ